MDEKLIRDVAFQIKQTMDRVISLSPDVLGLDEATETLYEDMRLNEVEHAQMLILNLVRLVMGEQPESVSESDTEPENEYSGDE